MGNVYYLYSDTAKKFIQLGKSYQDGYGLDDEQIAKFIFDCGPGDFAVEGDYFEIGEMRHEKDKTFVEVGVLTERISIETSILDGLDPSALTSPSGIVVESSPTDPPGSSRVIFGGKDT